MRETVERGSVARLIGFDIRYTSHFPFSMSSKAEEEEEEAVSGRESHRLTCK